MVSHLLYHGIIMASQLGGYVLQFQQPFISKTEVYLVSEYDVI